jgi:unsaturated chondroitin disaccharide hydrolase
MTSIYKWILMPVILCSSAIMLHAQDTKRIFKEAEKQAELLYKESLAWRNGNKIFPRAVERDSLRLVASGDWTSGFWPGIMWLFYQQTGKQEWKNRAEEFTALMEREPKNRSSHDVGFKVYNSYGNGYRLANNEAYKKQILQGAATLITRFNAKTGCIRSWDFGKWQYPVIIDNMMNLELLFAATRLSGDSSFYKIAVTHANMTMKNHFRSDYSSFHVIDYDTLSGNVIKGSTHQGLADSSAWARGQAWALYGYTMCYRETKDPAYLDLAENIALFLLTHPRLPVDYIPYWDFDASDRTRDASAAAIIASALYELKDYTTHSINKKNYKAAANRILKSLTSYRAKPGTSKGFILLHSTGNKPFNGEVDVPLIYADYYFLEALLRKEK